MSRRPWLSFAVYEASLCETSHINLRSWLLWKKLIAKLDKLNLSTLVMVEEGRINCKKMTGPLFIFLNEASSVFKLDELGIEIAKIAFPAALALTADPIASLIDTAFIGQIGSVELAAVGVSIALFNQVSRIAIFPLVSITTSFVAEEDTFTQMAEDSQDSEKSFELESPVESETKRLISRDQNDSEGDSYSQESFGDSFEGNKNRNEKKRIPSASSALIIGLVLGIVQAVLLIAAAQPLLKFMGVKEDSGMLKPAEDYLTLRSLGAPAVLLSLAMQGVFRGMKDTTTPLYATVVGDTTNIILDPIFIFLFHLGVRGAAIAHVISQYVMAALLFWRLVEQVHLVPPSAKYLQFGRFLKNGFMLLMRVIAVTFCVTLAASLAARLGATQMAAFQVCLQIWLATSLLADGLAVAGQAILASSFAKEDYSSIISTSSRVLQLGVVLGVVLTILLGLTLRFGAKLFTNDPEVLYFIGIGIPFVAATQPINSLAFVFDGVNFGASDFAYAAYSMVVVAIFSIFCLLVLSSGFGFVGIWVALTIYMSLRALAGFGRIGTGTGPWKFLRS